MKKIKRKKV
jgi:hypothetical protein